MSLKVKAKEREMKVGLYAGTYRYVMVPEIYSSLAQEKVIREAALRSGVSQGVMQACWDAAGSVIKAWATEGHSVALPGLGTMRFGLSKDELRNTSVIITCYDRDGKEVKRVTSADDGIVENNEDTGDDNGVDNGSTTGGNTSGGNTNGNSGSGSVSQGVTAPTFSGNTQFTESTQVSMSGPAGAEIRYTTDGSQPTAQSTLYSGPLTLTETTTVKAIAIKDGQSSAVTSRTYTKGSNSGGGGGENGDMD